MITTQIKMWLYGVGAAFLAALAFSAKTFKTQRDNAREKVDILKTSAHAERVKKEIIKEEEKKIVSRRADLIKELEKAGEDFKGLDNFNNSNDY